MLDHMVSCEEAETDVDIPTDPHHLGLRATSDVDLLCTRDISSVTLSPCY
jgi:hypothetical protein